MNTPLMQVYAGCSIQSMRDDRSKGAAVCALLEDTENHRTDKYEEEWNGFWKFANVMQFMSGFIAVSQSGIDNATYLALPVMNEIPEEITDVAGTEDKREADDWQRIFNEDLQYSPDDAVAFAKSVRELGIQAPDAIGYDVMDDGESVIGSVELAWTKQKVGYLTEDQEADKEALERAGWRLFDQHTEADKAAWKGNN